jgi:hypothetical protein
MKWDVFSPIHLIAQVKTVARPYVMWYKMHNAKNGHS